MRNAALCVVAGLCAIVAGVAGGFAQPGGGGGGSNLGRDGRPKDPSLSGQLKPHPSQYYIVYTDLGEDDTQEAILRMTKMAEAYHDRTKGLFRGSISGKLPFYLYAKPSDYYKAGGMAGTAGVFDGKELMGMAIRDKDGRIDAETWHVVQHEGFHQYVDMVIRGSIPTWVNEGLAEYFGESIYTGDGTVTGVVPQKRLERVKKLMAAPGFKGLKDIMEMSHEEWNSALGAKPGQQGAGNALANYDTAWAMVHFMAHADGGKYQVPFSQFLVQMGNGKQWQRAWNNTFGGDIGFEQRWREYWSTMPDNPTADLYAQAATAMLTSFLGRATVQKQTFESFDALIGKDGKDIKVAKNDWLPPGLFEQAKLLVADLKKQGATFTLTSGKPGVQPTIVCVLPDGKTLTGTYTSNGGRVTKVKVDEKKK